MCEARPERSTVSQASCRVDIQTQETVSTWGRSRRVPQGKAVGCDATTLEANTALLGIGRRDTVDRQEALSRWLEAAAVIAFPTRAALAGFNRRCPGRVRHTVRECRLRRPASAS